MASIVTKVTYVDGESKVSKAGPRVQVAAERHFKKSIKDLSENPTIEFMYFLAWGGLHFSGQESKDFDQFLDVVDDVEDVETDAERPTEAAQ